ncbi:DUF6219 family protein [Pilosibacter sp. HC1M1C21]
MIMSMYTGHKMISGNKKQENRWKIQKRRNSKC